MGAVKVCCTLAENLEVVTLAQANEERAALIQEPPEGTSLLIRRCRECRCCHIEWGVEPIELGMTGASL